MLRTLCLLSALAVMARGAVLHRPIADLAGPAPATSPHGHYRVHREGSNETRPNFVYFLPDETRAESLGVYGHPLTSTPNYERFLKSGASIFEQAHVGHTQCSPSRCNFITGRHMHVLGHRTQTHLVRSYEDNWLKYLKQAGYYVLWLGKNDMLSADSFPESVTEWHNLIGVDTGSNAYEFGEAGYYSFLFTGSNVTKNNTRNGDYNAVATAVQWMQERKYEPFFIWIPGMGAHPPYGNVAEFMDMYDPQEIKQKAPLRPPYLPNKPVYNSREGIPAFRNLTSLSDDVFYKINSVYLSRVTYSDWIFGQLLDGIEANHLTNTTVVAVSADHGDFAGDMNLVEKWPGSVDDVLTRVPLMMRVPGLESRSIKPPVQAMDAWATILDLAGINSTHVHFARSLRGSLEGAAGSYPRDDNIVFSEGGFYYDNEIEPNDPEQHKIVEDPKNLYYARFKEELSNYPDGSPRVVMIRNATHKLNWRPRGVSEMYDLAKDPRELRNVFDDPAYAGVRADLQEQLLYWYTQTADVVPLSEDSRGPPAYSSCVPPDMAGGGKAVTSANVPAMVPCSADVSPYMIRTWTLGTDGSIRPTAGPGAEAAAPGLCLSAGSGPASIPKGQPDPNGRNVTLEDCDPSDEGQKWTIDPVSGMVTNAKASMCLDAEAGPAFGQNPGLFPCSGSTGYHGSYWSVVRTSSDAGAPVMLQSAEGDQSYCLGMCASYSG